MNDKLSPMMKNYLQTKEQYPDCILLYRLGDFYEMFFNDAERASRILDLTLTGRNCGLDERAPMCGVPYHAVDTYIAKLLAAGEKVAICEQLTEPDPKNRELVQRDVVRVITAGTVMDSEILEDKRSNFIASVYSNENIGVAVCDLTTGDVIVSEFGGALTLQDLQEYLVSYKPSEIICNEQAKQLSETLECVKAAYIPKFSLYDESSFDKRVAREKICQHYRVATLDGFGLQGKQDAVCACGALLQYLRDTQKRELPHLKAIKLVEKNKFMSIDIKTRKNLELTVSYREGKRTGSLLWLLDKTETSMGARMLADWVDRPLQIASQINLRLDGVDELYRSYLLRAEINKVLHEINDIERLVGKVAYNNVTPKDCVILKKSLMQLPNIKRLLAGAKSKIIRHIDDSISVLPEVVDLLDRAIDEGVPSIIRENVDFILHGYNSELDELYDLSEHGGARIAALEEYERNRTGIKNLKLGYNKVFGYYFEITNSMLHLAPDNFIRKQTLTNGERFVSPELKEIEEKMLTAYERKAKLQKELFDDLRNKLLPYIPTIQQSANAVAALDCLVSLAIVAQSNGYCKPKINTANTCLTIVEGRHPIVECYIKRDNFITNDVTLDTDENRTMVITGPNMAGKSTFMRQVALITLMAHIGSFVPATSAEIPIVDKIFTRVGANDDIAFNQSTFMVEMVEVANILNNATKNSLIILDEVGRGTSTFDGLSIAWAVMEYVSQNICAKTLFSTHYHELTDLEGRVDGVKNYRIMAKELNGTIVFLHKIARGGTNKSFGIEVASLAGVPNEVCARAREIVTLLENSSISLNLDEIEQHSNAKQVTRTAQEVSFVLRDINMDRISPIEAFDILNSLVKKVKENG
ncbi:MAG: DNA mismatch repair protein MutS [Clostridiales bacterium]|nr:DNA mismatch repair protein MutS [Clostridiales bacterium]